MELQTYTQGWLDCMCGIYSIANAYTIVNNATKKQTQDLFNSIIYYLDKTKIKKNRMLPIAITDGINHEWISKIMSSDILNGCFPIKETNRRGTSSLTKWWRETIDFLSVPNRAIILSISIEDDEDSDGHLTVIEAANDRRLFLRDSSAIPYIRRVACKLADKRGNKKYIIYPSQCWYLAKE